MGFSITATWRVAKDRLPRRAATEGRPYKRSLMDHDPDAEAQVILTCSGNHEG